MVTGADVSIEGNKTALLKQKTKTMRLTVLTDKPIKLRTYSTEPKADYDAPNRGTRMIGFEVSLSGDEAARTVVVMTGSDAIADPMIDIKSVLKW